MTIFPGRTSPCCSGRDACQKILIKSLKETIVDEAQGLSYPKQHMSSKKVHKINMSYSDLKILASNGYGIRLIYRHLPIYIYIELYSNNI